MKRFHKKALIPLLAVLIVLASASGCQPTPEKAAVANKGGINLEQSIKETAAPTPAETTNVTNSKNREEKRWKYNKDYDSGNRLVVDAVMYHTDADKLPVLSVAPKMFESGDQLKTITGVFCPDTDTKIYDQGDMLTKSQLARSIMDTKEEIFRVENDMIPYEGAKEPIPEDHKQNYLNGLQDLIQYYDEQMETAPMTVS